MFLLCPVVPMYVLLSQCPVLIGGQVHYAPLLRHCMTVHDLRLSGFQIYIDDLNTLNVADSKFSCNVVHFIQLVGRKCITRKTLVFSHRHMFLSSSIEV